jgi:hypothetical protein
MRYQEWNKVLIIIPVPTLEWEDVDSLKINRTFSFSAHDKMVHYGRQRYNARKDIDVVVNIKV